VSKLLAGVALLLSLEAFAAEPAVPVQADVVFASTAPGAVEPSLTRMRDQMAPTKKYLTMRRLDSKRLELLQAKMQALPLPGGKQAELTLQSLKDNVATVKVKTPSVEAVHTVAREKSLYVPAGTDDGGDVWLVVSQPK
jgi:hypothetical protein